MKQCIYILSILVIVNSVGFYEQYYPLAESIVDSMTLKQKIGQTIQFDAIHLNDDDGVTHYERLKDFEVGSILVGGNGCPDKNGNIGANTDCIDASSQVWNSAAQKALEQKVVVNTPNGEVKISLLLGTDAVHGNQHVVGELLWPHNIALAATHNEKHFANSAYWTKKSILKSGFNFGFAPTVAVSHNPQWGRFYETLGTDPAAIKKYAKAYVKALQETDTKNLKGVPASTKHYIGDGATIHGCDEGNTIVNNFENFYTRNIQGYIGALEEHTATIMVSYSAINEDPMSIVPMITTDLKENLGFDGFLISDYNAVLKAANQGLPTTTKKIPIEEAFALSYNYGMDMQMFGDAIDWQISIVTQLAEAGTIPVERFNDAVKRILAVKLSMGLVEVPQQLAEQFNYTQYEKKTEQESQFLNLQAEQQEYADALQATLESFVLLKNSGNTLPLNLKKIKNVILIGDRIIDIRDKGYKVFQDFNNIGAQNGGWTVRWQGYNGNDFWTGDLKTQSRASSILDAMKLRFSDQELYYVEYSNPTDLAQVEVEREKFRNYLITLLSTFNQDNTVIVYVTAESPYAEFGGDVNCVYCQGEDKTGCLYNAPVNEYMPNQQAKTLDINFDDYSTRIINLIKNKDHDIPLVSILMSGRPMIINDMINQSQAFIAAWWPGTTGGEAITQSLVGEYLFRSTGQANTLPVPWIRTMDSLKDFPIYGDETPAIKNPLFVEGYGLATTQITE